MYMYTLYMQCCVWLQCAKILLELQDRLKAEIIAKLKLKEGEAVTEENIESFEAICNKAEQTMTTVDSEGGASRFDLLKLA